MKQRQVQAFRAVMQYGSITAAARVIGITQPAVSRLIADLEHEISFTLFERRGGKLLPTKDAIEFFGEVERLYYGLERLEQVATEISQLRRAALRIATMPMVAFKILPVALREFVHQSEGIRVTHDVHTSARVVDLVASRQYDLGMAQTHGERQDVEVLSSFRSSCICVMHPDHHLSAEPKLTPQHLDGVPMVALTHESVTATYVKSAFAEANVAPRIVVESQPSYAACALAASGLGVAIVDPMTPEAFGERLVRIPFEPALPFDFHVLKPIEAPLSRAAVSFHKLLLERLALMPGLVRLPRA